jgi:hypothetical protein
MQHQPPDPLVGSQRLLASSMTWDLTGRQNDEMADNNLLLVPTFGRMLGQSAAI